MICGTDPPHGLSSSLIEELIRKLNTVNIPPEITISVERKQIDLHLPPGVQELPHQTERSLYLPESTKDGIESLRHRLSYAPNVFKRYGLKKITDLRLNAIFFGPPGTGKTSAFSNIAHGIIQRCFSISLRGLVGAHLGDTEKNVNELTLFVKAHAQKPGSIALLIDDADDFLSARGNDTSAAGQTLNSLKIGMLNLLDTANTVPIILTTNRLSVLDPAIHRRIVQHIEFPLPDKELRLQIINGFIRTLKNVPLTLSRPEIDLLARESEKLAPAEMALSFVDTVIAKSMKTDKAAMDILLSEFKLRKNMKKKLSNVYLK
jgi:AAA+ superfamily predicted ATPase